MKYRIVAKRADIVDIGKPVMGGMSIEKANEELESLSEITKNNLKASRTVAIKLGIEALKQVKESRFDPSTWEPQLLPGETPEE